MASGRQLAKRNLEALLDWIQARSDEDYRAITVNGMLSRKEIAKQCGFARSVLTQNPRVQSALSALEDQLRERGVLAQMLEVDKGGETKNRFTQKSAMDDRMSQRIHALEQENAQLREEISRLRQKVSLQVSLGALIAAAGQ